MSEQTVAHIADKAATETRMRYTPCPGCLTGHDPFDRCPVEDPAYCWADVGPHPRHKWDENGVCNDSGITLGYRCRWCSREVSEIPLTTPEAKEADRG